MINMHSNIFIKNNDLFLVRIVLQWFVIVDFIFLTTAF